MTRVPEVGDSTNYDTRNSAQNAWPVYRRLVGYALRYRFRLAVSMVFSVVVAASFTSMIFAVGSVIKILTDEEEVVAAQVEKTRHDIEALTERLDRYLGWEISSAGEGFESLVRDMRDDRAKALGMLCIALVAFSFIGGVARFIQEYFAGAIGAKITVRLSEDMFENVLGLSMRFYEKRTTGDVVARFTNDVFMVNKGLANVFVKLFREPIKAVFFLGLALSVDPLLTLVVLLVVPPIVYVIFFVGKKVKKNVRRTLERVAILATIVTETVSGIIVIKGFRMESYQMGRVRQDLRKMQRHLVRMVRADATVGPATEFIMVLGLVAFVMLSERQVASGNLSGGDMVMLFAALAAMLDPIRKLSTVNNLIQTSVASAQRVFEFIDYKPEIVERPDGIVLQPLRNYIRFNNVHFSYDGQKEVLRGIDLTVKKGEMVALVGFSGAGKSTIAKLIPRFYDPVKGSIMIDGVDLRDATMESLRDQISIVTQDTILFHDTVAGNITFGQDRFTESQLKAAAKAANAESFIDELKDGYQAWLDESGGNLSGGQRQRLAIARAIIKDPAILILDEATSSLDSESERAIQDALSKFVEGRTSIVIAHRLSTIQRADRIVVIDKGCVAEEGTHEELLARGGIYQRLYELQLARPGHPAPK